ncbi:MAG TPA: non-canonical purine NTP pyrophosphatase, partial [Cytophagales bacterium]|nr:non-canonical purine NTP pyrophosphatase [Cytophagales bacterium]
AQFRTVVTLILPSGAQHQFEGIARGWLIEAPTGEGGFGYDPIFVPEGYDRTFAQMTGPEKNAISHRGIAIRKLIDFLQATEW